MGPFPHAAPEAPVASNRSVELLSIALLRSPIWLSLSELVVWSLPLEPSALSSDWATSVFLLDPWLFTLLLFLSLLVLLGGCLRSFWLRLLLSQGKGWNGLSRLHYSFIGLWQLLFQVISGPLASDSGRTYRSNHWLLLGLCLLWNLLHVMHLWNRPHFFCYFHLGIFLIKLWTFLWLLGSLLFEFSLRWCCRCHDLLLYMRLHCLVFPELLIMTRQWLTLKLLSVRLFALHPLLLLRRRPFSKLLCGLLLPSYRI